MFWRYKRRKGGSALSVRNVWNARKRLKTLGWSVFTSTYEHTYIHTYVHTYGMPYLWLQHHKKELWRDSATHEYFASGCARVRGLEWANLAWLGSLPQQVKSKDIGPRNIGHYLMRCDRLRHQFSVAFQMSEAERNSYKYLMLYAYPQSWEFNI